MYLSSTVIVQSNVTSCQRSCSGGACAALFTETLRRNWTRGVSARQRPRHAPSTFPERRRRLVGRRRLEAGVNRAGLAARIVAGPILLPFDPLEQSVVRREDSVVEQVARALPAVRIAGDRAPRGVG